MMTGKLEGEMINSLDILGSGPMRLKMGARWDRLLKENMQLSRLVLIQSDHQTSEDVTTRIL
jgi:hypothetical protein